MRPEISTSKIADKGLCIKDCKNRGAKCKHCFKFNGKETEYEPKDKV